MSRSRRRRPPGCAGPARTGERPKPPERPWYYGTTAVLGLVGAVLGVAAAVAALSGPVRDVFSSDPSRANTEIALDASAKRHAQARALRRAGGRCGHPGELISEFGEGRAGEIRAAVADQQAGGRSNLVDAIIAAVAELTDRHRLRSGATIQRTTEMTGAADDCRGEAAAEAAAKLTRRELDRTGTGSPARERFGSG